MSKYTGAIANTPTGISMNQGKKDQGMSFYEQTAAYTQLGEGLQSSKNNQHLYTRKKPGVAMVKLEQHSGDVGNKNTGKINSVFDLAPECQGKGNFLSPGKLEDPFSSRNPLDLTHNVSNIPFVPNENSHWQSFIKDFPDLS